MGVSAGANYFNSVCSITAQRITLDALVLLEISSFCYLIFVILFFLGWTECSSHWYSWKHSTSSRCACQWLFLSTCIGVPNTLEKAGSGLRGQPELDAKYLLKPVGTEGPHTWGIYVRTWCNRRRKLCHKGGRSCCHCVSRRTLVWPWSLQWVLVFQQVKPSCLHFLHDENFQRAPE